jgi:hypothetical protein
MIATANPTAAGMIDRAKRSAMAASIADFSVPTPGNESEIPETVPIIPTNGAVAATVARPHKPRAIFRWTTAAERSAACWAKTARQFTLK